MNFHGIRVFQFVIDLFLRIFFQVQYVGAENLPASGPVVIASNHPSYLDPVLLQHATSRWVRWLALKEILGWPVIGPFTRWAGMLEVGDATGERGHALWRAMQVLEEGGVVGIFPEGGRSDGPLMGPVKPGLGRLALVKDAVVVPAVVIGAGQAWPQNLAFFWFHKIVVVFLPPMKFDGPPGGATYRRIAEEVREKIVEVQKRHPLGPAPKGSALPHATRY